MPPTTRNVLPMGTTACTATNKDHKPPKPLLDARSEFDAYLRKRKAPGHFLFIDIPIGPMRRQDVSGIPSKQRAFIEEHYRWDDSKRCWTLKNGGRIVTEHDIYDVILSHHRVMEQQADDAVYEYMKTRFEGVHLKDVEKAYALWCQHSLGDLDRRDDSLWGGPPATLASNLLPYTPPKAIIQPITRSPTPSTSIQGYTFHPHKKHTLLVGISGNNGKNAWLSLNKCQGKSNSYRSTFYDHQGILHTEDQLNVVWHCDFEYSRFPLHYQKQKQRRHIYQILEAHEAQATAQGRTSGQSLKESAKRLPRHAVSDGTPEAALNAELSLHATSNKRRQSSRMRGPAVPKDVSSEVSDDDVPVVQAKRRRRTRVPIFPVATPSHESNSEVEVLSTKSTRPKPTDEKLSTTTANILSSSEIAATTLLVSASNKPGLAPVHVPFRKCPSHKKLFETLDTLFEELATMGYFTDQPAGDFDMVSTTHTWLATRQLLRRGNDDDWEGFLRTLERAWKKMGKIYEGDDCTIDLLVHVKG